MNLSEIDTKKKYNLKRAKTLIRTEESKNELLANSDVTISALSKE